MRKVNRIICLVLALCLFAAMAMGSGSSDDVKDIVTKPAQDSGNDNTPDKTPEKETEKPNTNDEITVAEQIILDRDGVKITVKEYVEDFIWGEGIKVLVENSTEKNLTISCNALIVNNYMVSDMFVCSVAAGKKANETIYLLSSELEAAGIDMIGQIEIYFHVYDSDSYDTVFDSECITLQTSVYDKMDVTPADTGIELYNNNGIRIVGKVVDENSFWGTAILLYLENNSGQNITVSSDNMSINGFMVSPFFACTVYDGKMAITQITIFSSDLEDNDIDVIEDIELSFHIYNSDTYSTIVDTDPIAFSVNN